MCVEVNAHSLLAYTIETTMQTNLKSSHHGYWVLKAVSKNSGVFVLFLVYWG